MPMNASRATRRHASFGVRGERPPSLRLLLSPLLLSVALLAAPPTANGLARGQEGAVPTSRALAGVPASFAGAVALASRAGGGAFTSFAGVKKGPSPASIAEWWVSFSSLQPSVRPLAGQLASTAASGDAAVSAAIAPPHSAVRAPVATERLLSRSLSGAAKHGLLLEYSVDQKIAGQFEVMMAASRAKSLRIYGFKAAGLPKGYPPQTVIAMHLLVTMHAAKGRLRIHFPPQTRKKLRRLHKLALTVRLVVRNASRLAPKAAFVRRGITLRG
jgi:hypothetical protein